MYCNSPGVEEGKERYSMKHYPLPGHFKKVRVEGNESATLLWCEHIWNLCLSSQSSQKMCSMTKTRKFLFTLKKKNVDFICSKKFYHTSERE